jgi:hypothetical protein
MLPLDVDGTIYAIQDEHGKTIGTGTREICEVLLRIIQKQHEVSKRNRPATEALPRHNLRSAIVI